MGVRIALGDREVDVARKALHDGRRDTATKEVGDEGMAQAVERPAARTRSTLGSRELTPEETLVGTPCTNP